MITDYDSFLANAKQALDNAYEKSYHYCVDFHQWMFAKRAAAPTDASTATGTKEGFGGTILCPSRAAIL